jgi:tetratricopeptide (TPR) repeat protein
MEEVSWGQRIVGIPTPELLEAYNYQGELTLHNIWFPRHTVVGSVVVLFGVGVPPLARRWGTFRNLLQRLAVPLPRPHLRAVFVVAGALLVLSAYSPLYLKIDEVGEFALGVAVLLLGLELAMEAGTERPPGARAMLLSGAGALTAVVVATGILVHLAPYPDSLRWRLHDFAAHRFPDAGMHSQAEILFEYMGENPELQAGSTHVEHGRLLLGLGQEDRARRALRRALEAQETRLARHPAALPAVRRVQAEAHLLLGQPTQAEDALQEALAVDRVALERTDDEAERAEIHWSLALSAELYGDEDAALHHATTACQLAEDRVLRRRIEHWGEELWGLESEHSPCEEARGPV